MGRGARAAAAALALWSPAVAAPLPATPVLHLPLLSRAPRIDGDLSEWRDLAFTDGLWDLFRLRQQAWFQPGRNRLTDHGTPSAPEPRPEEDLAARYFTAWDADYLYLGAEVRDNANDASDPAHEPKRWYFKDSVCWFVEAPRDTAPESFGRGDNAFCFVIDASRPPYGAWWRHGTATERYLEEPLPAGAVDYALRVDPAGTGRGDFALEARVRMAVTLGASDPDWQPPLPGHEYGLQIVHCDPDGGPYGGHFLVYGTGDDDGSWGRAVLSDPIEAVGRAAE